MSIYDGIAEVYEKWSLGDIAYNETFQFYTSLLKQMTKGSYLELGVGTGRISIEAVKYAPINILGIDLSEKMLRECEKNYKNILSPKGKLVLQKGNFININYSEEFEGAIMPFRTIGHIMNNNELEKMFQNVFVALKSGGWFLFDHYMFQQKWAEEHNNQDIVMYNDGEIEICDNYQYDFKNEKMHCEIKINGIVNEIFEFRWLSPKVFYDTAIKTGFEIISLMGEFDGTAWTPESYEQIWLLKKPGNSDVELPKFIQ